MENRPPPGFPQNHPSFPTIPSYNIAPINADSTWYPFFIESEAGLSIGWFLPRSPRPPTLTGVVATTLTPSSVLPPRPPRRVLHTDFGASSSVHPPALTRVGASHIRLPLTSLGFAETYVPSPGERLYNWFDSSFPLPGNAGSSSITTFSLPLVSTSPALPNLTLRFSWSLTRRDTTGHQLMVPMNVLDERVRSHFETLAIRGPAHLLKACHMPNLYGPYSLTKSYGLTVKRDPNGDNYILGRDWMKILQDLAPPTDSKFSFLFFMETMYFDFMT